MKLVDFVRPELIIPELTGRTKPQVIAELARHLAKTQPSIDAEALSRVLMEREDLASTAIGEDIAIPHGKLKSVTSPVLVFVVSQDAIQFDAIDNQAVDIFCAILIPENQCQTHLTTLAGIARLLSQKEITRKIRHAGSDQALYQLLLSYADAGSSK